MVSHLRFIIAPYGSLFPPSLSQSFLLSYLSSSLSLSQTLAESPPILCISSTFLLYLASTPSTASKTHVSIASNPKSESSWDLLFPFRPCFLSSLSLRFLLAPPFPPPFRPTPPSNSGRRGSVAGKERAEKHEEGTARQQ